MAERERQLGLTFAQVISLMGVVAIILTAWISMNIKLADINARVNSLEQNRIENRQEHQQMIEKLDKLIYNLTYQK